MLDQNLMRNQEHEAAEQEQKKQEEEKEKEEEDDPLEEWRLKLYENKFYTPPILLAIFTCINFCIFVDRGAYAGMLVPIREDEKLAGGNGKVLSMTDAGVSASVFMVGFLLASSVVPALGNAISTRMTIVVSLLCWCVSLLATALAPNFGFLIFARCLDGIGEGASSPVLQVILDNIAPKAYKTVYQGIFQSQLALGTALGLIFGSMAAKNIQISESFSGWRFFYILLIIPGLILTVICYFLPKEFELHSHEEEGEASFEAAVAAEEGGEQQQQQQEGENNNNNNNNSKKRGRKSRTSSSYGSEEAGGFEKQEEEQQGEELRDSKKISFSSESQKQQQEQQEEKEQEHQQALELASSSPSSPQTRHVPILEALKKLLCNLNFLLLCAYISFMDTILSGVSALVSVAIRERWGLSGSEAGALTGGLIAGGGLLGVICGAYIADLAGGSKKGAEGVFKSTAVISIMCCLSVPFAVSAILSSSLTVFMVLFMPACFLLLGSHPVLVATMMHVVEPELRTACISFSLLTMHAFGDAPAPSVISAMSDSFGGRCISQGPPLNITECLLPNENTTWLLNISVDQTYASSDNLCRWMPAENSASSPYCASQDNLIRALLMSLFVYIIMIPSVIVVCFRSWHAWKRLSSEEALGMFPQSPIVASAGSTATYDHQEKKELLAEA